MKYKIFNQLILELKGLPRSTRVETDCRGAIGHVAIELTTPCSSFSVEWQIPQDDIQFRWVSSAGKIGEGYPQFLPPSWCSEMSSELCKHAPVFSFIRASGQNRLIVAVSDSQNQIEYHAGISEDTFMTECRINFSNFPSFYRVLIRFDLRDIPFSEALREVSTWWEQMPKFSPMPVPDSALEPVYSTWYSYHRNISAKAVEQETELGLEYGLKTIIVDDGWQNTGSAVGYAFAGDWEIDQQRFPDMKEHIRRVQTKGVRYLLWIALPFVGEKSQFFSSMKGQLLYFSKGLNTWIVDPRFPKVRAHLINVCIRLVHELNLDGLKIDFLDRFPLPADCSDPASSDGYDERDERSINNAANMLLEELCNQLRMMKNDILIEFRQDYIGPAMRKYANIFRASDCPGDHIANRRRIINLRLLSGETAVHSDMLGWHPEESVESVARQLWNIVLSVPQISVPLAKLSPKHRQVLFFYLSFWRQHRELFLHGKLTPLHPELNYPLVVAENSFAIAIILYMEQNVVTGVKKGKELLLINASVLEKIFIEIDTPRNVQIFDCCGNSVQCMELHSGIQKIHIPPSGYLFAK